MIDEKGNFAVLGLGRFGSNLALDLARMGHEVLAVDNDEAKLHPVVDVVDHAAQADITDEGALRELGVADYSCACIAVTDLQTSILCVMHLKRLGIGRIHCKVRHDLHREILEHLGADQVVFPEQQMAAQVARDLGTPNISEYLEVIGPFGIGQIEAPSRFIGRSLADLDLRANFDVVPVLIRRGSRVIMQPELNEIVRRDDVLVLAGRQEQLGKLTASA